jgi:uncharacterized protein YndB with AHSA1/START domain
MERRRSPVPDPEPGPRTEPTDPTEPAGLTEPDVEIARVERAVRIEATPASVWQALTDPEQLAGWLQSVVQLDGDMAPGTVGRVTSTDGLVRHLLVTTVEAPHRLAWHWWHDGGELSAVEITVAPVGEATEVRVVETVAVARASGGARASVAAIDAIDAIDARWASTLPELAARLVGRLCAHPTR